MFMAFFRNESYVFYYFEGDPTTFGNLKPPKEVIEAVQESVASQLYNGYAPSTGNFLFYDK